MNWPESETDCLGCPKNVIKNPEELKLKQIKKLAPELHGSLLRFCMLTDVRRFPEAVLISKNSISVLFGLKRIHKQMAGRKNSKKRDKHVIQRTKKLMAEVTRVLGSVAVQRAVPKNQKRMRAPGRKIDPEGIIGTEGTQTGRTRAIIKSLAIQRKAIKLEKRGKPVETARLFVEAYDLSKGAIRPEKGGHMGYLDSACSLIGFRVRELNRRAISNYKKAMELDLVEDVVKEFADYLIRTNQAEEMAFGLSASREDRNGFMVNLHAARAAIEQCMGNEGENLQCATERAIDHLNICAIYWGYREENLSRIQDVVDMLAEGVGPEGFEGIRKEILFVYGACANAATEAYNGEIIDRAIELCHKNLGGHLSPEIFEKLSYNCKNRIKRSELLEQAAKYKDAIREGIGAVGHVPMGQEELVRHFEKLIGVWKSGENRELYLLDRMEEEIMGQKMEPIDRARLLFQIAEADDETHPTLTSYFSDMLEQYSAAVSSQVKKGEKEKVAVEAFERVFGLIERGMGRLRDETGRYAVARGEIVVLGGPKTLRPTLETWLIDMGRLRTPKHSERLYSLLASLDSHGKYKMAAARYEIAANYASTPKDRDAYLQARHKCIIGARATAIMENKGNDPRLMELANKVNEFVPTKERPVFEFQREEDAILYLRGHTLFKGEFVDPTARTIENIKKARELLSLDYLGEEAYARLVNVPLMILFSELGPEGFQFRYEDSAGISKGFHIAGTNLVVLNADASVHEVVHELHHKIQPPGKEKRIRIGSNESEMPKWFSEGTTELLTLRRIGEKSIYHTDDTGKNDTSYAVETLTVSEIYEIVGGGKLFLDSYATGDFTRVTEIFDKRVGEEAFEGIIKCKDVTSALSRLTASFSKSPEHQTRIENIFSTLKMVRESWEAAA